MRSVLVSSKILLAVFVWFVLFACGNSNRKSEIVLDLSGEWSYALDSVGVGVDQQWYDSLFAQKLKLPGTLDDAGIGTPNSLAPKLEKPQILHLTRKHTYVGAAWYVKEFDVPERLDNKTLRLTMERVLWTSDVWIDGKYLGKANSLVAPHRYNIPALPAGKHRMAIRIDNRKQYDISVNDMAHAYTNQTQVMWNGILGDFSLSEIEPVHISRVQVFPDIDKKGARVVVEIENELGKAVAGTIKLSAKTNKGNAAVKIENFHLEGTHSKVEYFYHIGDKVQLWNEFHPEIYILNVQLQSDDVVDEFTTTFGMRKLTNNDGRIQVNGTRVFLRGTLECCIFPLTGHPPVDKAGWHKVFDKAHQWGLNHIRFHSWCPPEAAFQVADEMGFYLQIELPLWSLKVGEDSATTKFIQDEAQRILETYGNHPSFCLWSMGNELEGDAIVLSNLVDMLKTQDDRHLYMNTTFSFQAGLGSAPVANDDFFVAQWTKNGWIRGQGVFNSESPSFNKNYSASLTGIDVPVISHEIGQYSVYPNIGEIEKYTGTLIPLNFMAVKEDLKAKGLLKKADDYLNASGKLAAILYKEEIERALKTPGFSGFQLLDLHDFPGQGTALVGLLDAFWESKGVISAEEFSAFCAPVVPLIDFPKAVYTNSESFVANAGVANFSEQTMTGLGLKWSVENGNGEVIQSGSIFTNKLPLGYNAGLGAINVSLDGIQKAQKLQVKLAIEGTSYCNSWNIWVYPFDLKIADGDVFVTRDLKKAKAALNEGRKVLFNPEWKKVKGIEGKFVPVFWSPVHFPKQAGTMGVLCNPEVPALKEFPTEAYSNWQWWDLNINSTTVILDSISTVTPLVEMVDNFANNRRLASVFEAKVGNGTLIFSSIDLMSDIENRPAAKQLLYSFIVYMNSDKFNPVHKLNSSELDLLLTTGSNQNAKKKSEDIY